MVILMFSFFCSRSNDYLAMSYFSGYVMAFFPCLVLILFVKTKKKKKKDILKQLDAEGEEYATLSALLQTVMGVNRVYYAGSLFFSLTKFHQHINEAKRTQELRERLYKLDKAAQKVSSPFWSCCACA